MFAENEEDKQELLNAVHDYNTLLDVNISVDKTKIMQGGHPLEISWNFVVPPGKIFLSKSPGILKIFIYALWKIVEYKWILPKLK